MGAQGSALLRLSPVKFLWLALMQHLIIFTCQLEKVVINSFMKNDLIGTLRGLEQYCINNLFSFGGVFVVACSHSHVNSSLDSHFKVLYVRCCIPLLRPPGQRGTKRISLTSPPCWRRTWKWPSRWSWLATELWASPAWSSATARASLRKTTKRP